MKRIGLIDYYLSEWHANHYPEWIRQANEALRTDYRVTMAWAECEISPIDGVSTDEWCEKNGVTRAESISALCAGCDAIFILAPSNPEKHLPYAKEAFPFAKPTFVDKTFAPSYAEALEIVELANRFGTPVFSSSALRYAEELDAQQDTRTLMVTGSGSSVEEYIVHLAEMVVKKLGVGAQSIRVQRCANQHYFHLRYTDDREAMMVFAPRLPYTMQMTNAEGKSKYVAIKSAFFPALMAEILRFFESGETNVSAEETLEVMRLCQGAVRAANTEGENWIEL